jgi:hypothetical protein
LRIHPPDPCCAGSFRKHNGEHTVLKKNQIRVQAGKAAADWKIIECQKHLLVIDVAGKTVRLVTKPPRLKGKPRYKVPPDCDPTMW